MGYESIVIDRRPNGLLKMGVSKGMVGKKRWKLVAKKEKTVGRKF